MVFVEITTEAGLKVYFVGKTVAAVVQDASNPAFFFGEFTQREMEEDEVRSLGLRYIDDGIAAVQGGKTRSYMLHNPANVHGAAGEWTPYPQGVVVRRGGILLIIGMQPSSGSRTGNWRLHILGVVVM